MRHLVSLFDISEQELQTILSLSEQMKQLLGRGCRPPLLQRRVLAMLFEKPSLRTRVSFEAGIQQLGGAAMFLGDEVGWKSRESTADFVHVLSQYTDFVVCRAKSHASVEELAKYSSVPVINGLTDLSHPCQAMADLLTMQQVCGPLAGKTVTFVGDGNNVARSLAVATAMVGMRFRLLGPERYQIGEASVANILKRYPNASIVQCDSANEMLAGADFVYTDVWTSMGQEAEAAERRAAFAPFQVNCKLMAMASPNCRVLHCLPARRGEEITDDVMDSQSSVVVEQAGNRMHAQKGLLVWLAIQHGWLDTARLTSDGIQLPVGIS